MISKLDTNNIKIKYIHTQAFNEFLKYNIINLNSFTLSYNNGIDYLGFPLSKELVNDLDISLITLFMEFLFDRFGKDKLWYLSDLNEGYNLKTLKVNREYSETICSFDLLDKIFEYHNVPKKNLLVHTANLNMDDYWDYEFTTLYNLPHFIRPFEENLINKDKVFEKKFTFLNRVPKNHRIYLYEAFKKASILNEFYYSINAENNPEYPESITIEDTIVDYQTLIKLGKIDVYDKSFCSIITESEYYSGTFGYSYKSIFFTEKTIKPIINYQPFIIAGGAHSLKKLKEMGFQTFSKYWDESYDDEIDDKKRLDKIIETVHFVNSFSNQQINDIYKEIIPILENNYNIYKKFNNNKYNINFFFKEPYNNIECFWE
jgi:hypothetical protein